MVSWQLCAQAAPAKDGTGAKALAPNVESSVDQAREAFVHANELAKQMRWAEALTKFQLSMALRPHAATAYNIGLCYRALGQYTRAYAAFQVAETRGRAAPEELTRDLVEDANAYVLEIHRLLVRVEVQIEPTAVELVVDGRALEPGKFGAEAVWYVGTRVPNSPEKIPEAKFVLALDPGTHLLVFSRFGFSNVLVRRSFAPGERASIPLKLDSLPGHIDVTANVTGAVIRVDGLDEGALPVSLSRKPGRHHIEVRHPDYIAYKTDVVLRGGEATSLRASLADKPNPITKRWWFWGAAATVVGIAIAATIIATRPAPQRPAIDGGSLGWPVDLR